MIETMTLYFFIYGFLGWCSEVIYSTLKTGKFINRGFLNGPICSIYGFGMLLILSLLSPIHHPILLLITSIGVATLLEFITGYTLEKFFHKKWWDYSNEPFNLKGYICLRFSILWGLCALLIVKVIHPMIEKGVSYIHEPYRIILIIVFLIIYTVDNVITILQILKFDHHQKELEELKKMLRFSSDKIGSKVSNVTLNVHERIDEVNSKIKNSRLGKAFPSLHHHDEHINNKG